MWVISERYCSLLINNEIFDRIKYYISFICKNYTTCQRRLVNFNNVRNIFAKRYSSWLVDIGMAIFSHYIDCCWSRERLEVLTSSMCD